MRTTRWMLFAAALAISTMAAPHAHAQSGGGYNLTWNSLDCGSATTSTGNNYSIRSTIGQAESGGLAGGAYSMQGGWRVPTDAPSPEITDGTTPLVFRLHDNVPNPFANTTAIAFTLPKETHVALHVYDMAGRRVRSVVERRMAPGRHQVMWDGRDESGRRAAHGIYLLRLKAGELHARRKLALVP